MNHPPQAFAPPYLFLLGGHDLEMQEIKALLHAQGQDYCDLGLPWGAKLSAYTQQLTDPSHQHKTLVGIELTEDIAPPSNYLRIDHHGDLVHRPSAITQVADLLGIALSRWQELVAANDSAFIPGMLSLGASSEEVQAIRTADRKAQGVTEFDEALAEESIRLHLETKGKVTLVKSLPGLFTPITDRMYGKTQHLLVWRETKLTYYGTAAPKLAQHFAAWVQSKEAYFGGGYFGIDEAAVHGDIQDKIKAILEVIETQVP